eukprot:scaffold2366_cov115-Cylindrotheca_fusiformis.AAC.12
MVAHGPRIVVPKRSVQGGMDFKFETDPYDVDLHGLLTREEYTAATEAINKRMRKARPGAVDNVLLATGMLMVPLMLWGVRHRSQVKKRKRQLNKAIDEFNAANPTLMMRWNKKPKSMLTIERREGEGPEAMAQAQYMGDMVVPAPARPPATTTSNTMSPHQMPMDSSGLV